MASKKIIIFDTDSKVRHIVDIMCHKVGYKQNIQIENMSDFNDTLQNCVDSSFGSAASAFGGKSIPRLDVACLIIDWDAAPDGIITFIKKIKSRFSGRYGIMLLASEDMGSKFMMASKAGVHSFLIKPFKQDEFKKKLRMAIKLEAEPIVQSFNMAGASGKSKSQGFGENPFSIKQEEKKRPLTASQKALQAEAEKLKKSISSNEPAAERPLTSSAAQKVITVSAEELKNQGGAGIAFVGSTGAKYLSDTPVATLVDGKIDGHYHENVNVIGGGENCYWATESGKERVVLNYLSAKGRDTGMEAKVITRGDFMHSFFLCQEHGCSILKRLGKWTPKE